MHDAAFLTTATRHGGGLMRAAAAYPDAPRPWLDLSTGINPEPWRGPRAAEAELNRLPDPGALVALETTAAAAFGATTDRTAAVAGAEAPIRLLPLLLGVRSVEIVGPTYGAHAEAWRAAGVATRLIAADQAAASQAGVLVIVNPNNPDGRLTRRADLIAMARERSAAGRWLVVDESFIECAPDDSVSDLAEPGLIVLRSFGKFYGLAGLRLGFALGAEVDIARLAAMAGPWAVSGPAIQAGTAALQDRDWQAATAARLVQDGQRLDALAAAAGWRLVGGAHVFRLYDTPSAAAAQDGLARGRVWSRIFPWSDRLIRLGLPGPQAEWAQVEAAFAALSAGQRQQG